MIEPKIELKNRAPPIIPDCSNWGQSIKDYYNSKHNPIKYPFDKHYHQNEVTSFDKNFNPILQQYNDKDFDKQERINEKKKLTHSISQCYDNQMKNEQSYNIISLKDKFENFPPEDDKKNLLQIPKKNDFSLRKNLLPPREYNILSNIPTSFQPGKNGETRTTYDFNTPIKQSKTKSYLFKDFDIISNKYKSFNDEKQKLDREMEILEAAKMLNERKDFNIIKNRYYNENLNVQNNNEEWRGTRKNDTAGADYRTKNELYNPVNKKIYNQKYLDLKDSQEYHKKDRYRIKPEIENLYRERDYIKGIMDDKRSELKVDYKRYKIEDKRGYDILSKEYGKNKYYNGPKLFRNKINGWDLLKSGVNQNETISKKNLFIPPFMAQEADKQYKDYPFYDKTNNEAIELIKNSYQNGNENNKDGGNQEMKMMHKSTSCCNFSRKELSRSMPTIDKFNINKDQWFKNGKNFPEDDLYFK